MTASFYISVDTRYSLVHIDTDSDVSLSPDPFLEPYDLLYTVKNQTYRHTNNIFFREKDFFSSCKDRVERVNLFSECRRWLTVRGHYVTSYHSERQFFEDDKNRFFR